MPPLAKKRPQMRLANLPPDVTDHILTGKRRSKGAAASSSQSDGKYGALRTLQVHMRLVNAKLAAVSSSPGPSKEPKKRGRPRKHPLEDTDQSADQSNTTPLKTPRLKVPKKEILDPDEPSAVTTEEQPPSVTETEKPASRLSSRMSHLEDEPPFAVPSLDWNLKARSRRSESTAKDAPGTSAAAYNEDRLSILSGLREAQDKIAKLEQEKEVLRKEKETLTAESEKNTVEIGALHKRCDNLVSTNGILRTAQATKTKEAAQLKEELDKALAEKSELETTANEAKDLREQVRELKQESESLRSKQEEQRKEHDKLQAERDVMENRLKTLLAENAAMRERHEKAQAQPAPQAAAVNGTEDLESEMQQLKTELARLEKELERVEKEREWFKQKLTEREREGQTPEARTRALRAELKKAKTDLEEEAKVAAESTRQLEASKKKAKGLEAKVKEQSGTITSQRDQLVKQVAQLQKQSTVIHNYTELLRSRACLQCVDGTKQPHVEKPAKVSATKVPEVPIVTGKLPTRFSARLSQSIPPKPVAPVMASPKRSAPSSDAGQLTPYAVVAAMLGDSPGPSRRRNNSTSARDAAMGLLGLAAGANRGRSHSPTAAAPEVEKSPEKLARSVSMTNLNDGEPAAKKQRKDEERAKSVEKEVFSDSEVTHRQKSARRLSTETPERPASQPPLILKFARDASRKTVKSVTVDVAKSGDQAAVAAEALPNGHADATESEPPVVNADDVEGIEEIIIEPSSPQPQQSTSAPAGALVNGHSPNPNVTRYVPIAPKDPSKPPPSPDKEFRECLNSLMQKLEPLKEKEQARTRHTSQGTSSAHNDSQVLGTPILHPIEVPRNTSYVPIRPLQATIVTTPLSSTSSAVVNGVGESSGTVHVRAKPANPFYHRGGTPQRIVLGASSAHVRPVTAGRFTTPVSVPMVNGHAVNGVPRTAPGTSRAPAKTPSPWLTAQCKDIIGKIVEANQKYRVSFDVIHATLIREHPGQTEMIDAIVQAAKIAIDRQPPPRSQFAPIQNGHGTVR